eukprot:TRINITY_DN7834_c0_g1_i1.p2 TRINITY_DN7834_c0_g1~~TRINITY_DN7834_c0_g1_i1.p2  ORF type:complete len:149 (-),score=30.27 TRINITY_DN7834_c0_g1_i1:115-561(-)
MVISSHCRLVEWGLGESHCNQDTLSSMWRFEKNDACIVTYRVNDRSTFELVPSFVKEIRQLKPNHPIVIVGMRARIDEERQVKTSEGKSLSRNLECGFIENSRTNIDRVDDLIQQTLLRYLQKLLTVPIDGKLEKAKVKKKKERCTTM